MAKASAEELEIIKNYCINNDFPICKTWKEVSIQSNILIRKNNALKRGLSEDSTWESIHLYDKNLENLKKNFNSSYYGSQNHDYDGIYDYDYDYDYDYGYIKQTKKKDIVPEKLYYTIYGNN